MSEHIQQLTARRDAAVRAQESMLLELRNQGHTHLTEAEATHHNQVIADIRAMSTRIADLEEDEQRAGMSSPLLQRIRANQSQTRSTPMNPTSNVYRPHGKTSYFRDLMRVQLNMDDTNESRGRLAAHAEEIANTPDLEHRDLSRVDGNAGYFSPPAWLVAQYAEYARPGRPTANLCQRLPLPGGVDVLNVPKILTGTQTAIQTGDNVAIQDVDLTDTFVAMPIRTIAGQQGIAQQLLDQSPVQMDEVLFKDLIADYAMRLDQQVLYGNGSSGQILGIANTPGITSIAVSALTIQGIYSALSNAIQLINSTRFLPPEVIVMAPRRWGWLLSLLDNNSRPLFCPEGNGPFNAAGILTDVDAQNIVGRTHGLPICVDANITTTAGAGSNEDQIYVMRSSDLMLFESGQRARVLPEPKASTLTVLCQVFGYLAFSAARFPQSIVQLTGLTPPSF
jgi:HK97 family phage major capsid protein